MYVCGGVIITFQTHLICQALTSTSGKIARVRLTLGTPSHSNVSNPLSELNTPPITPPDVEPIIDFIFLLRERATDVIVGIVMEREDWES